MPHETVIADGSFDFSGGVDSNAVTTVQSQLVPNGLARNKLAWLSNGTVRGGGILQRTGQFKLQDLVNSGLFQGMFIYNPLAEINPFLIVSVSGILWKMLLDPPYTVTNLSARFGLSNPASADQVYFCQGEAFLVIQAGDFYTNPTPTLPLFYWFNVGSIPEQMVRSRGIIGIGDPNNQLPAATCMSYYAQRVWYGQGRIIAAGDIVGNTSSGNPTWRNRDSILAVTENPLAAGGDGFTVPSEAGNVRALAYTANLDTTLGQGPLYVFTRKQVYQLTPPATRTDWIAANTNNQPVMTVAQINNGTGAERSVMHSNGDLMYQSLGPDVRSLFIATRYFQQWGNVPISTEERAVTDFIDRGLQRFASGVEFDNRMLQLALPQQTPSGVVFPAIMPLNYDTISTLGQRNPPAWEGSWSGVPMFQIASGDFGGRPRCFAAVLSEVDSSIDVWELTDFARTDNGDNRVYWFADFPAYTWGKEFELKKLLGGEIWIDKVFGEVRLKVFYRPDADPCYHYWHSTKFCVARNCQEDDTKPVCYPTPLTYREGYRFPIVLPAPPNPGFAPGGPRPWDIAYQFQPRVEVYGWCRIRGIILYAEVREKQLYDGLVSSRA